MAERILDDAVTVAPEHVGDGHDDGCTRGRRSLDEGIDVFDDEMNGDRRPVERFRRQHAVFRSFIDKHDRGAVDAYAGVHQLAVRPGQPDNFVRDDCLLIERDGVGRAGAEEVRREGMDAVSEVGRDRVWTPGPNSHLLYRVLLDKKNAIY